VLITCCCRLNLGTSNQRPLTSALINLLIGPHPSGQTQPVPRVAGTTFVLILSLEAKPVSPGNRKTSNGDHRAGVQPELTPSSPFPIPVQVEDSLQPSMFSPSNWSRCAYSRYPKDRGSGAPRILRLRINLLRLIEEISEGVQLVQITRSIPGRCVAIDPLDIVSPEISLIFVSLPLATPCVF